MCRLLFHIHNLISRRNRRNFKKYSVFSVELVCVVPIQPSIVKSGFIKHSYSNNDDDYDGVISDDDNDMPAKYHHDKFPPASEQVDNDNMGFCRQQIPTIQLTDIGPYISQNSSMIIRKSISCKFCHQKALGTWKKKTIISLTPMLK